MSFDLMDCAKRHRLRTRNLHDGRPLHPLRLPPSGRGRAEGYIGKEDRMDVIIGQRGYICDEGDGRLGWYLFARSAKGINRWLPKLEALGAVVEQEGDSEAAGHASVGQIDAILEVLKPYRRQPENAGTIRRGTRTGARIDANAHGGAQIPPDSKSTAKRTSVA